MPRASLHAVLALCGLALSCGGGLSQAQAMQLRQRLRAAMQEPVASRAARDQHSRTLAEVANAGALDGLDQAALRAAFGPGQACRTEICAEHGFSDNDWYYPIGVASNPKIKQLPLLIIGFDSRGRAARVWTLTTH